MRSRALILGAAMAGGALLSSCSGGQTISTQASTQLESQVQAVRDAASAHDAARAGSKLAQLRAEVTQLQRQGQISPSRAKAILAAADAVQAQLASIPAPTTTTTLPPPTPSPPHDHGPPGGGGGGHGDGGGQGGGGGGD